MILLQQVANSLGLTGVEFNTMTGCRAPICLTAHSAVSHSRGLSQHYWVSRHRICVLLIFMPAFYHSAISREIKTYFSPSNECLKVVKLMGFAQRIYVKSLKIKLSTASEELNFRHFALTSTVFMKSLTFCTVITTVQVKINMDKYRRCALLNVEEYCTTLHHKLLCLILRRMTFRKFRGKQKEMSR